MSQTLPTWSRASLLAMLDHLGLDYRETQHDAVYTMADSAALGARLAGCRGKSLLVQNKKGTARFLIVTHPDTRADLTALGHRLGVGRLSFCPPEAMQHLLSIMPGAASPLALAADTQNQVQLLMDMQLQSTTCFLFHPLVNTSTIAISTEDLQTFLVAIHHPATFIEIPQRHE